MMCSELVEEWLIDVHQLVAFRGEFRGQTANAAVDVGELHCPLQRRKLRRPHRSGEKLNNIMPQEKRERKKINAASEKGRGASLAAPCSRARIARVQGRWTGRGVPCPVRHCGRDFLCEREQRRREKGACRLLSHATLTHKRGRKAREKEKIEAGRWFVVRAPTGAVREWDRGKRGGVPFLNHSTLACPVHLQLWDWGPKKGGILVPTSTRARGDKRRGRTAVACPIWGRGAQQQQKRGEGGFFIYALIRAGKGERDVPPSCALCGERGRANRDANMAGKDSGGRAQLDFMA